MVKIRFTAQGSNALIGGFSTGDVANVGEALGKHLVEEARVARYMDKDEPRKLAAKPAKGKPKTKTEAKAAAPAASAAPDAAVPPAPTSEGAGTAPEVPAGD